MISSEKTRLLSSISPEHLIGRTVELDKLLRHAKGQSVAKAMTVLSTPGVGLSELLRQVYDQLFYEQGEIIPFYFQIKKSDRTSDKLAVRFVQSFLQQVVAFRRNDPGLLNIHPDLCEIAKLMVPTDGEWIDGIVETCDFRGKLNDLNSFIRQSLSAPLRASASGANVFVIIDNLENAEHLTDEFNLVEELKEIYSRHTNPFVFAGKRRFVYKAMREGQVTIDDLETIDLRELSFADSGLLVESISSQHDLHITDQTRDLIVQQFGGNTSFVKFLFQTARERGLDLDTFHRVEEVYSSAVFGGKIQGFYDSVLDEVTPNVEVRKQLINLLHNGLYLKKKSNPIGAWRKKLDLKPESFYRLMSRLNTHEIVRQSSNMIEVMKENATLCDYITSRFRLEIRGDLRSLVVAESLSGFLKKAPINMAKFYRRKSAAGIREVLSFFDCQEIPNSLVDYSAFKKNHKGKDTDDALRDMERESSTITLPKIVYTAHTVSLYSPISKLTDTERSAVALGFEAADYKDENEIVWIAAEIDSKLEADEELTAFWCDRLEVVALMCDFARYRLWLIAPEGFSPEAVKVLNQRNAIGSNRKQVEMLARFIDAEEVFTDKLNPNEYEMVLPMGDDTELIAAYAVEEIARRHSFGTKAINQIKTALVEACINATEHSHSPDRKIYQKFSVEDDKIVITISNRGLRFKGKETTGEVAEDERRGWGLKLMKSLMDEVKFEQVEDGTRISMTKKLVG